MPFWEWKAAPTGASGYRLLRNEGLVGQLCCICSRPLWHNGDAFSRCSDAVSILRDFCRAEDASGRLTVDPRRNRGLVMTSLNFVLVEVASTGSSGKLSCFRADARIAENIRGSQCSATMWR